MEREVVSLKWIYKIKLNQEGDIQKHKARLVVGGSRKKQVLIFMKLSLQLLVLRQLELKLLLLHKRNGRYFNLMLNQHF